MKLLTWLTVLVAVFVSCPVAHSAPAVTTSSFKLPLLSVDADNIGTLNRVEFTLNRKIGAQTPLSIAISEDTPGGTGESLRASVWLAATVAALNRLDDLSGVKIYLDLPGQTDGPSAGGVICLAILSALDGRAFPDDCAMTGCIMPDGTIGPVGGIASKIRAAATGGAKRVLVPAYLRFEDDPKTGEQVDLKRLALSLRIEFLPVQNITQAYRIAHRLPSPGEVKPDTNVLDLSDATEDLLKQTYSEELAAGMKLWDQIPKDQQDQIAQDAFSRRLLIGMREKADGAFRSGKLLYAADGITTWRLYLNARKKNEGTFAALSGKDFKENIIQLDGKLKNLMQAVPDPSVLIDASRQKLPDAGIQLCAEYYEGLAVTGLVGQLQMSLDGAIADMAKPENQDQDRQKVLLETIVNLRGAQLLFAQVFQENSSRAPAFNSRLAATLPKRDMTGDVGAAERLFYSSYLAALNSFDKDVVSEAAAELHVSEDQAVAAMSQRDMSLTLFAPVASALPSLQRDLTTHATAPSTRPVVWTPRQSRFTEAAAAHIYADNLAKISSLTTRWGSQLAPSFDDQGNMRYGRTDLLNYLLSVAHDNALATIAECRKQEIPCILPIASFQAAELERDDKDEDKVDVLRDYWNASLQAKLLLMLFGKINHS